MGTGGPDRHAHHQTGIREARFLRSLAEPCLQDADPPESVTMSPDAKIDYDDSDETEDFAAAPSEDRPMLLPPEGWDQLEPAFGPTLAAGRIRCQPEDFRVIEELGFEASGDGDYIFLHIRKREANTQWVARLIARATNLPMKRINYAGQKDRYAITEQTFSVHRPGKREVDWSLLENEPGIEILSIARNRRMIRRGGLSGNRFRIVVRELGGMDASAEAAAAPPSEGDSETSVAGPSTLTSAERAAIEARLTTIRERGVPNYFGPQRFGHAGGNLPRALGIFDGTFRERDRFKRGMYVSAARSLLFNQLLCERVRLNCWDRALAGDAMMLEGSRSFFKTDALDPEITRRVAEFDIHPTGPLWGLGEPLVSAEALEIESAVLAPMEVWRRGLESVGTKQERRALRLPVRDLTWEWLEDGALAMDFGLAPGAYATTVLGAVVAVE